MSFRNLFNKENRLTYHEAHLDEYISNVDEGDMSYLTFIFCALTGSDSAQKIKAAKKLYQVHILMF